VLDAGVDRVRIAGRRLEMPDARELPRVRRPVVPEVGAGNAVVDEAVPRRLPRLAPVVGALDQLTEPGRPLRGIHAIRIGRRRLQLIHLRAAELGAGDVPSVARAVRFEDEAPLTRANQYSSPAHLPSLP